MSNEDESGNRNVEMIRNGYDYWTSMALTMMEIRAYLYANADMDWT